ncbi:MAG: hypothetical protein J7K33_07240 [Candidatus Marinimicrobia bacterium]|nr:hypothetical protein [Candidatus Neomarinimicrobiota bacterium]
MMERPLYRVLLIAKDEIFGRNVKAFLSNYMRICFHVRLVGDIVPDDVDPRGYDVALLDISSLRGRALGVLKRVKGVLDEVPIIAVTSVPSSEEYIMKLIESGADDYLIKENLQLSMLIKSILLSIEKNRVRQRRIVEEKLKSILQLAGAVCHELNQPLQVVSGYLHLIFPMFERKEYDEAERVLRIISKQIECMADIVDKLSRITSYKTIRYLEGQNILDIESSTSRSEQ